MKIKTLFAIVIIAIPGIACASRIVTPSPAFTPWNESSPVPGPAVSQGETLQSLGEVRVYRDDHAGLALDYPAAWALEDNATQGAAESAVYTSSLFSWDRASFTPAPKDLNALPGGATKIDITVFNQGPDTLADAVGQFKNQDSGSPVTFLKEEDWILNSGAQAVYIESEGALGVVATVITIVNDRVVYLSGCGNLIPFRAIALTLRSESTLAEEALANAWAEGRTLTMEQAIEFAVAP